MCVRMDSVFVMYRWRRISIYSSVFVIKINIFRFSDNANQLQKSTNRSRRKNKTEIYSQLNSALCLRFLRYPVDLFFQHTTAERTAQRKHRAELGCLVNVVRVDLSYTLMLYTQQNPTCHCIESISKETANDKVLTYWIAYDVNQLSFPFL